MYTPEGYSLKIFKERYAFTTEETWEEACSRLARQMALAEIPEKQKTYEGSFFNILSNNLFVPGGRIWYGAGRTSPNMLNCFVLRDNLDSKEGWGELAREMIVTSMHGGGCGVDFSDVRPRGAPISGHRGECPGPVELMRLINNCASPIRAGGIRRVALMFSLDLDHPDIEEFLDAKLERGELTYANVSVRSKRTSEFMKAVKKDGDWELSWKGKYKKVIKARPLWEKIVKNAYNSAEPGFLNWEMVLNESNIYYIEELVTTNPSLRKGTKVITDKGIFPIEQLENKSIKVKNLNGNLSDAKCFLSGKNKQLYKLTLSTGMEYYCTPEHKWPIKVGNRFLKTETTNLVVGDKLPVIRQNKLFDGTLGTKEDGFIIGWLYGDGWVTERQDSGAIQFGFIVSEKDQKFNIHTRISKYLTNITGKDYQGSKNSNNIEFNVSNIKIKEHFEKFGVQHKSKGLPLALWQGGSEDFRKGFIDGLLSSDGYIDGQTSNRIVLVSSKEKLIKEFSELLGFYGIRTKLRYSKSEASFPNGKDYNKEYERYELIIGKQPDLIHFRNNFSLSNLDKNNILDSYTWTRTSPNEDVVFINKIELTDLIEDVWDISVYDTTHCFQLSHCVTGNCGEIALSSYDCCCLGHLVLPRFVSENNFQYDRLGDVIRNSVRFLDNVLTVNSYPMLEMKNTSHKFRRIGLGTTGLADALALLGYKYGSEDANKFIDKLYRFISKAAYESSIMLAIEKGPFPACVPDKHIESGFMRRMPAKIRSLVKEHGIRNCAILTQAPTGCQKPDTMIISNEGIFELQELGDIKGAQWQKLNIEVSQDLHNKYELATQFYINGVANTKKITLSSGVELESTLNHQYRTLINGDYSWTRADRLSVGDKLVVKLDTYNKKTDPKLSTVEQEDPRENIIKQPEKMNAELAKFLGYFYADGSVHHKGIRIACNAGEDDFLYVKQLGENIFGIEGTIYNNKRNCVSVCFNSQMLLRWLKKNDILKQESTEVEIPLLIRKSSRSSIESFIEGYWSADGSVSYDNRWNSSTKYIDTSSKKMAQQLITVLRALGQESCIQEHISGMGSLMYRVKFIKTKRRCETKENTEQLKKLGLEKTTVDTIVSIEDSINMTLDIEVPNTVTYIANSVVSHNTVSILSGNCSSGIEPMFAPAYERRYWVGDKREKELVLHPLFVEFMKEGKSVEHFVGSREISVKDHMEVQRVVQKHVDNAVSKTINIAEDYPIDKVESLWMEYLPSLKGTTFYRENTRGYVNAKGEVEEPPLVALSLEESKKRFSLQHSVEAAAVDDCPNGVCEV